MAKGLEDPRGELVLRVGASSVAHHALIRRQLLLKQQRSSHWKAAFAVRERSGAFIGRSFPAGEI
jgi:hypothetical protein